MLHAAAAPHARGAFRFSWSRDVHLVNVEQGSKPPTAKFTLKKAAFEPPFLRPRAPVLVGGAFPRRGRQARPRAQGAHQALGQTRPLNMIGRHLGAFVDKSE